MVKKVKIKTDPLQKENRVQPFSHIPEKFLSPKKTKKEATKPATGMIKAVKIVFKHGS